MRSATEAARPRGARILRRLLTSPSPGIAAAHSGSLSIFCTRVKCTGAGRPSKPCRARSIRTIRSGRCIGLALDQREDGTHKPRTGLDAPTSPRRRRRGQPSNDTDDEETTRVAQLPEVREYNGGYARLEWLPDNRPERLNPLTKAWEPTPAGAMVQVITGFYRQHPGTAPSNGA